MWEDAGEGMEPGHPEERDEPEEEALDKGREFDNYTVKRWCSNRNIKKTFPSTDNFKMNRRAEITIQQIKGRTRKVLHAGWNGEWWPCAAHVAMERLTRRDEKKVPNFGQVLTHVEC